MFRSAAEWNNFNRVLKNDDQRVMSVRNQRDELTSPYYSNNTPKTVKNIMKRNNFDIDECLKQPTLLILSVFRESYQLTRFLITKKSTPNKKYIPKICQKNRRIKNSPRGMESQCNLCQLVIPGCDFITTCSSNCYCSIICVNCVLWLSKSVDFELTSVNLSKRIGHLGILNFLNFFENNEIWKKLKNFNNKVILKYIDTIKNSGLNNEMLLQKLTPENFKSIGITIKSHQQILKPTKKIRKKWSIVKTNY